MQNLTQSGMPGSKLGGTNLATMNGNVNNNIYTTNHPENFIFEQEDPSLEDDDSDSDTVSFQQGHGFPQSVTGSGLKPGKKTKGRVKIKMEFIENKLRRYTTFSKRKTGIMKKAYELSTLTGTQVMLLVASETGHVYTFATRKLQPMITSESGKALIQTCLNSPDPPPGSSTGTVQEQRMNPSGFEETDLSCAVDEEQNKTDGGNELKTVYSMPSQGSTSPVSDQMNISSSPRGDQSASVTHVINQVPAYTLQAAPVLAIKQEQSSVKPLSLSSASNIISTTSNSVPTMQIPIVIQSGQISMLQPGTQLQGQTITAQNELKPAAFSQVVSNPTNQMISSSQNNQSGELNTPLPVSTPSAISFMQGMTPGIIMYQTPQGIVYATPTTQNFHDRTVFNFPQTMSQTDQASGQQIFTIPVPVSLGASSLLHLATAQSVDNSQEVTQVQQPPPAKKAKK
ncbi:serum response factor-like [Biomphalaria glabrata]|uniref:Serum response factor-like n=1 Tax=Biomphalaria glabrata TaxID=6526 RepID=A0A9U8E381_BIOGL|nr:serum response factor-like [Biomphalaria glabrata]KAI8746759.1 serum response factor-like [Biomphalaria glabrata]